MSKSARLADAPFSPDQNAFGLLTETIDPFRYDGHVLDPDEVGGIVAEMVPQGARVLDVGCGSGSLALLLASSRKAQVVGIEPDPARADLAARRGVTVHAGYFTPELSSKIGRFDFVIFADVLEHLPNPHSELLISREFLNPQGCVIASVPNVAHWSVRLCLLRGKFQYMPYGIMDATHLRWFTANTVKSLFASSGFKVIEYRATAGSQVPDNYGRAPLRWLAPRWRNSFLRISSRAWPALFGCQHVVKAVIE